MPTSLKKMNLIADAVKQIGYPDELAMIFQQAYSIIMDRNLAGMCHAISSVLYVSLSELGYHPELCIGEVDDPLRRVKRFDHSWIVLDGRLIDIAIALTIADPVRKIGRELTGPVILDIDVSTESKYAMLYGVKGIGLNGLQPDTRAVMQTPFLEYMDNGHLWDLLAAIHPQPIDSLILKGKYSNVKRNYIDVIESPYFPVSRKQQWLGKSVLKDAKVSPNDPCPCGSGMKYKKCCGRG